MILCRSIGRRSPSPWHFAAAVAPLLLWCATLGADVSANLLGEELLFDGDFEGGAMCGAWSGVVNPELCNGIDDDCDDVSDDGDPLDCVDGDGCTADSCDEASGDCSFDPYDSDSDPAHCGDSCLPCPLPEPAQVHTVRACVGGSCSIACAPGHWDVDAKLANGCEVACDTDPATTADLPDDSFLDSNCDGIDGTIADGIFVATTGSNANPGTIEAPVATIAEGLAEAQGKGKAFVYVANGSYSGAITVVAGIGIHGGYGGPAWSRAANQRAIVTGPPSGALVTTSVATTTVVEYLEFRSQNGVVAGSSSTAVTVTDSPGLRLRYATVVAGNGANGADGASAGLTGSIGGDGTVGANGFEDDSFIVCVGDVTDPPLSHAGGVACTGGSNKGGDGRRGCKTNGANCAGTAGDAGSGVGFGPGGLAVSGGIGGSGQPGQPGGAGTDGAGGSGGSIVSGAWMPDNGDAGGIGGAGGGGGGGAGGGSTHLPGGCNDWGGGGGGGGGGGCGGTGGASGQAGGASLGILIVSGSLTAHQVDVSAGLGGEGGDGRSGGDGGPPGIGKSGGSGFDEALAGGSGGNGGGGGRGGHGGGGAGGWSVCVYRNSGATYSDPGGTLDTGAAGVGGASPGNDGVAGSVHSLF